MRTVSKIDLTIRCEKCGEPIGGWGEKKVCRLCKNKADEDFRRRLEDALAKRMFGA